jgi:hypothetical protein
VIALPAIGRSTIGRSTTPAIGRSAIGRSTTPAIGRSAIGRSTTLATMFCSLGLGLGLTACGGSSSTASSPAAGAGTPDAATLIARAASQKIDSMSFTLASTVPGVGGAASSTLNGAASLRLHPSLAGSLTFTAAGHSTTERIAGTSFYIRIPTIAAHDGGRPWVVVDASDTSKAVDFNYAELVHEAQGIDPTKSLELLAAKRNFHEIGTTTIDGQRVVGLTGAFTPATLTAPGFSPSLLAQLKAKLAQVGASRETVTIELTYAGVPVRIVTALTTKTFGILTSTVDISAVNAAVATLAPPPASQTVSLTELQKLTG